MAHRRLEDLWVVVHGRNNPSAAEWSAYLAELSPHRLTMATERTLVLTAGGGPNAGQRAQLSALVKNQSSPAAIVTASVTSRAIVTAIGLFVKGLRSFSPSQVADAMTYLGVPRARHAAVLREANALAVHVGDPALLEMLSGSTVASPPSL